MKYLLMLIVCFGFLISCDKDPQDPAENTQFTELEKQVEALKQQLTQATDPATISKLQKELLEKLSTNIDAKRKQIGNLYTQIEATTDQASCDTLKAQIEAQNKELDALVSEFDAIAFSGGKGSKSKEIGTCSATGYACPTSTKNGQEYEQCYNNGGGVYDGGDVNGQTPSGVQGGL